MKKFWLQIGTLLIVIFSGMILVVNPNYFNNLTSYFNPSVRTTTSTVRIVDAANNSTKAEVAISLANTSEKRKKGLSGVTNLPENSGMLFVFEQTTKPIFWMKGVKIPLDIIWIRGDQVVDLIANLPIPEAGADDNSLPRFAPNTEVDKALEVNSGFIEKNNIRIGDRLEMVN